jgi:PadR family transcriptional regulator, regulatory protein PadR
MEIKIFKYIGCPIYHMKDKDCCDMRGMLSFLILFILSKKTMHGQEISKELERRRGDKPSPGTIYPALKSLKKHGFLKEKKSGKTIVYDLTPQGHKALTAAKKHFCKVFIGLFPE